MTKALTYRALTYRTVADTQVTWMTMDGEPILPSHHIVSLSAEELAKDVADYMFLDEADDVNDEYLRLHQQMEFSAKCTVSPKFIREFSMATGLYWIGKVPRVIMKRWWR